MTTIVELAEDRVVEGVFGVAKKQRLRTKAGTPYLALELVDPSGRIDARVWQDVELLDGRFGEGDAVRVLGRVERFRDRLQLVRIAAHTRRQIPGVGFRRRLERAHVELQPVAKALDAAEHAHRVALVEPRVQ